MRSYHPCSIHRIIDAKAIFNKTAAFFFTCIVARINIRSIQCLIPFSITAFRFARGETIIAKMVIRFIQDVSNR